MYKEWQDMSDFDTVSRERHLQLVKAGHIWEYTKVQLQDVFVRTGLEIESYKVSVGDINIRVSENVFDSLNYN